MTKSMKWRMSVSVTAIAMLAWGLYAPRLSVSTRQARNPPAAATASAVPAGVLAQLDTSAAQSARQQLVSLPNPSVTGQFEGVSQEALREVLASYREMLAVQGLYNQEAMRKQLVERILKIPQGTEITARVLTEPQFSRGVFGGLQAEARFYSSYVLKEAALRGQERPLLNSVQSIARRLSQDSPGAEVADKGSAADLYELVEAFVDIKGADAFASGNKQIAEALGYNNTLSSGVKHIIRNTVFHRLDYEFGRENAVTMTAALFN